MKKNILPFGIIAVVGIFAAIIVFYIGVEQREDIRQAEENGGEVAENNNEGEVSDDPEEVFVNTCASCHGEDLSGVSGPDLTKVGNDLSADDIANVINEGQGSMPGGLVDPEEADMLADWLSEMK